MSLLFDRLVQHVDYYEKLAIWNLQWQREVIEELIISNLRDTHIRWTQNIFVTLKPKVSDFKVTVLISLLKFKIDCTYLEFSWPNGLDLPAHWFTNASPVISRVFQQIKSCWFLCTTLSKLVSVLIFWILSHSRNYILT